MTLDLDGYVHVADNGVVRSYTAKETVIDYFKLNTTQLADLIDSLPPSVTEHPAHFHEVCLDGKVDGPDVPATTRSGLCPPVLGLHKKVRNGSRDQSCSVNSAM